MALVKNMVTLYRKVYGFIDPLLKKARDDNLSASAGYSTFCFILAFVPLTMFAVSILQNLHIPIEILQDFLGLVLNESATAYLSTFLNNMYSDAAGISIITLIVTLYSASQGMYGLIRGLNRIHATYDRRNWIFQKIRGMVITLVLVAVLVAVLAVFVLGNTVTGFLSPYMRFLPDPVCIMYEFRYFILYICLIVFFALLYRNVPNLDKHIRKKFGFLNQLPGAVLCATGWFVLSVGISVYVDDFGGFSVYGGLTRLAVIMVWLYMLMNIFMYCAEINFVYHDIICSAYDSISKKMKKSE